MFRADVIFFWFFDIRYEFRANIKASISIRRKLFLSQIHTRSTIVKSEWKKKRLMEIWEYQRNAINEPKNLDLIRCYRKYMWRFCIKHIWKKIDINLISTKTHTKTSKMSLCCIRAFWKNMKNLLQTHCTYTHTLTLTHTYSNGAASWPITQNSLSLVWIKSARDVNYPCHFTLDSLASSANFGRLKCLKNSPPSQPPAPHLFIELTPLSHEIFNPARTFRFQFIWKFHISMISISSNTIKNVLNLYKYVEIRYLLKLIVFVILLIRMKSYATQC